jgi:hypothetical protein
MKAAKKHVALARVPQQASLDLWATRITSALQKTVEGIFETGQQLLAAREALEHGQWERLFSERRVPMTVRSAQMFIEVYKRRELLVPNAKYTSRLPASWYALYLLARLPDDTLEWAHTNGKITPDLEQKQIKQLRAEYDGAPVTETTTAPFLVADALTRLDKTIRAEWQKWPSELHGQFLHSLTQLQQELSDEP